LLLIIMLHWFNGLKNVIMKKYQVSVVIINYNSSDYTLDCVKSIIKTIDAGLLYNIVIVDNNSKEDDFRNLSNNCGTFGNVQIVKSKINLGFSGGNMFGVQYVNAQYIFFLNNDTVLLNDCISILYRFMIENSSVGICTGQMYNSDMSFHHSFNYFPTLALKFFGSDLLRLFNPRAFPNKKVEYKNPLKVNFVTGAAMFIDYSKFAKVAGFDTNHFLYCEEEDIAMKLKRKGYSAYLVPEAKFIHHMGKSTKRNFLIEKENYISLLYYHRKYSSAIVYFLLKVLYAIKSLKKFYKGYDNVRMAAFIIKGANPKYSLKNKQELRIE